MTHSIATCTMTPASTTMANRPGLGGANQRQSRYSPAPMANTASTITPSPAAASAHTAVAAHQPGGMPVKAGAWSISQTKYAGSAMMRSRTPVVMSVPGPLFPSLSRTSLTPAPSAARPGSPAAPGPRHERHVHDDARALDGDLTGLLPPFHLTPPL